MCEIEQLKQKLLFNYEELNVYAGITKKEFPKLYEKIKEISQNGFNVADTYDKFDEKYKYLVCIAEYEKPNEIPFEKDWEIVSFYRYALCKDTFANDEFELSTNSFYNYSLRFKTLLPFTLELGRSVVNKSSKMADNGLKAVWGGLGAMLDYYSKHGRIEWFWGEVSLQKDIYAVDDLWGNDSLLSIMSTFILNFGKNDLLSPRTLTFSQNDLEKFAKEKGFIGDYQKDSTKLRKLLKDRHTPIPHLFFHYANLVDQGGLFMYLPVSNPILNCWEMGLLLHTPHIKKNYLQRFTPINYNPKAFE